MAVPTVVCLRASLLARPRKQLSQSKRRLHATSLGSKAPPWAGDATANIVPLGS